MNSKIVSTSAIVALLVVLLFQIIIPKLNEGGTESVNTTFAIVNQKQRINCGYISYPPAIFNDGDGKVVGIFAEAMEKAASNLGWEVNWVEGDWSNLIANLDSKRWDAYCGSAWKNIKRILAADFGIPLYYSYLSVWGKPEIQETSLSELNTGKFTVAVLDGDTSMTVADQAFPHTTRLALTELNSYSDIFNSIVGGRADFTIAEGSYIRKFNSNLDGVKLVEIGDGPIRLYPNAMMFRKEDIALRRAVSSALEEIINEGLVNQLIQTYAPGEVLKTARPFEQQ